MIRQSIRAGFSHYRSKEAEDGLLGGVNQLGFSVQHRLMRSTVTQDAIGHYHRLNGFNAHHFEHFHF